MFKLDLEKAEEPEVKLPTFTVGITEKASEFQENIYFSFYYTRDFGWITTNCGKF